MSTKNWFLGDEVEVRLRACAPNRTAKYITILRTRIINS